MLVATLITKHENHQYPLSLTTVLLFFIGCEKYRQVVVAFAEQAEAFGHKTAVSKQTDTFVGGNVLESMEDNVYVAIP